MFEPSFIAPLVPRTAADERWHLRAELRDAAIQSFIYTSPCLLIMAMILMTQPPWHGTIVPAGIALGWQFSRRSTGRPRTNAGTPPLQTAPIARRLHSYERRLIALIDAQKGDRAFCVIFTASVALALNDLMRLYLDASIVQVRSDRTMHPVEVLSAVSFGLPLFLVSALAGYGLLLGLRYLAARRAVAEEELLN